MWLRTARFIDKIRAMWTKLRANPDAGYASEAVLVTALLIICAMVVIGIIVAKVTSKAESIDFGMLALMIPVS